MAAVSGDGANAAPEQRESSRPLVLQNSFSSTDFALLGQLRDEVEKHLKHQWKVAKENVSKDLPRFTMIQLLTAGCADRSWFRRWLNQLIESDGVVIINSKDYRAKVKQRNSALWQEAQQILIRLLIQPEFRVYVLDPDEKSQGPHDLRCWLLDGELEMNSEGWKRTLTKLGCNLASEAVSHCLAASVRAGKVTNQDDFRNIARHLQGSVHPHDAALLLAKAEELELADISKLCEDELQSSLASCNFEDLTKISGSKLVSLLDSDEVRASEDTILKAIFLCTQKNVAGRELWSTCRFAFLSVDSLKAVEKLDERTVPQRWFAAGMVRRDYDRNGDVEGLKQFLEEKQAEYGVLARRLYPRGGESKPAPAVPSPYDADRNEDLDTVDFSGTYVDAMYGTHFVVSQNGGDVTARASSGDREHSGHATGSMIHLFGCTGELTAGEICWSNGLVWKAEGFLFELPFQNWDAVMEKKLKDLGFSSNAAADIMVEDKNGMQLSLQFLDNGTPKFEGCAPLEKAFPLTFRSRAAATAQTPPPAADPAEAPPPLAEADRQGFLKNIEESPWNQVPNLLHDAGPSIQSDRICVIAAIKKHGLSLKHADNNLKADRELVHAALKQNGFSLQFAHNNLKADKDMVMTAVRDCVATFEYAADSLKADKEFVLAVVKLCGYTVIKHASSNLRTDKNVWMAAVQKNASDLHYADDDIKADKEVVLEAVRQDGYSVMEYTSQKFLSDKDVWIAAIQKNGSDLQFAPDFIKHDKEVSKAHREFWKASSGS